jgi:hypothetical protein
VIPCARCGHRNQLGSNFCSSCGTALEAADDDTTLSLSAVEAEEVDDELAEYLADLPPGAGMLVIRHGPNAGSLYRLAEDVTTAGRHPESDIFFDDITVSRRHVRIWKTDDGYKLQDTGSLNGTYVNRRRIDEAALEHGDEVQIGRYRLTFVQGR